MSRIALGIEYEGTDFSGWQFQPNLPSIQQSLEEAISSVANESVRTVCAGRTDKGVHALGQVAHFDTHAERSDRSWLLGINSALPRSIKIHWIKKVSGEFHARFDAMYRQYCYVIVNSPTRPAINRQFATWHIQPLNVTAMQKALEYLLGTHDFSAFRGPYCQAKSPIKTMLKVSVVPYRQWIYVNLMANAFLHHMVRNIVGVLLAIGEGRCLPERMSELLTLKDRQEADVTAPSNGLFLVNVGYPESWKIPEILLENYFPGIS